MALEVHRYILPNFVELIIEPGRCTHRHNQVLKVFCKYNCIIVTITVFPCKLSSQTELSPLGLPWKTTFVPIGLGRAETSVFDAKRSVIWARRSTYYLAQGISMDHPTPKLQRAFVQKGVDKWRRLANENTDIKRKSMNNL